MAVLLFFCWRHGRITTQSKDRDSKAERFVLRAFHCHQLLPHHAHLYLRAGGADCHRARQYCGHLHRLHLLYHLCPQLQTQNQVPNNDCHHCIHPQLLHGTPYSPGWHSLQVHAYLPRSRSLRTISRTSLGQSGKVHSPGLWKSRVSRQQTQSRVLWTVQPHLLHVPYIGRSHNHFWTRPLQRRGLLLHSDSHRTAFRPNKRLSTHQHSRPTSW